MNAKFILLLALLTLLLIMPAVMAESGKNLSYEEQAILCIEQSRAYQQELSDENFTTLRVNDTLREIENLFSAQETLKGAKKAADFSVIIPYCGKIRAMRDNAFNAMDEFDALMKFYNESITLDMNASSVDMIFNEIREEIESERYEDVAELVDKAYSEITVVQSSYSAFNVFYSATSRGLGRFLADNWIYIVSGLFIFMILFFVYKKSVYILLIKKKIRNLNNRKDVLKGMIQDTQMDYFNQGNISEGYYRVRIKKFAELIRDIDRQIPLLEEEIMKIDRKKTAGGRR